jgi:AraC family transcriptional regulator of adaptative response / DNA-3-methyladenine glycosylase II
MRVLRDPDAFPEADLGVRHGAAALGIPSREIARRAEAWRPWRAYAVMHLWRAAAGPV